MVKLINCQLIFTLFFSGELFANEYEAKLTYRTDTQTFIPASHEFINTDIGRVSIDAPIGDNVLMSPIVKLKINGQGPFIFLFDTGFSHSMISHELIEKLKLTIVRTDKVVVNTPGHIIDTFQHVYFLDKIEIGNLIIKDYGVMASHGVKKGEQDFKKLRVDGVLSANAFYGLLLTLDYKKEKIVLENKNLLSEANTLIHYSTISDVPLVKVKLKFDKLKKVAYQDFILDTGFGYYLYINACKIPEMLNFSDKENIMDFDYLDNERKTYFSKMHGDIIFSNEAVIKSPYITFGEVNCQVEDLPGLIGRKFFEKYKVSIDQVNGLIKIEKY